MSNIVNPYCSLQINHDIKTYQTGWSTPWPHLMKSLGWHHQQIFSLFYWLSISTSVLHASGLSSFRPGSETGQTEPGQQLQESKRWWIQIPDSAERRVDWSGKWNRRGNHDCAPSINYFLAWIRTRASKQNGTAQ